MKRSKKGISLAFVIVVVMALMILSAMLFSAASHSMDTTGESTDGRQTYLTAKSAVEYAKTVAFDKAKTGGLQPFSVGPSGGGYAETASAAPNGTTVFAQCTNPSGDGQNWKVLAKVKYKNSAQYRQLAYTFTLQYGSSLSAVNSFVAAGWRYGSGEKHQLINPDGSFWGDESIPYPLVSNQTVKANSQNVSAPEMYFLYQTLSFQKADNGSGGCTLDSNLIFFNGPIKGGSTNHLHNPQSLTLQNTKCNRLHLTNGYNGIVWFHNVTISNYGVTRKMNDGAYYFKDGVNLFDYLSGGFSGMLKSVSDDDFKNIPSLKAMNLPAKVAYYEANVGNAVSSESSGGVGWTVSGEFNINSDPVTEKGNDVYFYVVPDAGSNFVNNLKRSLTYEARSIAMQYMGTQDNPFTIPKHTITFQTGTFWLNGQSEDGYPEDDTDDDDMPAIQGATGDSHFVVQSPDGSSPVTLILPHGLVVKNLKGKTVYRFDPRRQARYNKDDASTFTFTVPSGTDLLSLSNSAGDDAKDRGLLTPAPAGSGSGGGSGGFTITPGPYSGS